MGICAYIDILGFKNFVNENPHGAIMVLQNYQVQLLFPETSPTKPVCEPGTLRPTDWRMCLI